MEKAKSALEKAQALLNQEIQNVELDELREEYQDVLDSIQEGLDELEKV